LVHPLEGGDDVVSWPGLFQREPAKNRPCHVRVSDHADGSFRIQARPGGQGEQLHGDDCAGPTRISAEDRPLAVVVTLVERLMVAEAGGSATKVDNHG